MYCFRKKKVEENNKNPKKFEINQLFNFHREILKLIIMI